MAKKNSRRIWLAAFCWPAIVSCGCATWESERWKLPSSSARDVRPMSKERAAAAARSFDAERNRAQYQAALSLWRQGDFVECRETLEKILFRDPTHRDSLLLTADLELESDQPAEAVAAMRRAAEAHAEDAEVMYKLGLALEANHESSEALHYFHQAMLLEPTKEKFAEAYAQAEQSLSEQDEPRETRHDVILASAQLPVAEDAPADDEIDAALDAWQSGRKSECSRLLQELLTRSPQHVEANILQAEVDLAAGLTEDARDRMERLAIYFPGDPQVRRACGLTYQALGETEHAEACFARAAQLEGGESVTEAAFVDAIEVVAFETPATENEPPLPQAPPPPQPTGTKLEQGLAALHNGKIDNAESLLTAAIAAAGSADAAVTASVTALQSEHSELAAQLADAGLRKHPRSAALYRIKGTALLRTGRDREAESALQQSLSLDNTQALTYFLLGSVLKRLDQTESAQWHFSQAARLDGRYALRK